MAARPVWTPSAARATAVDDLLALVQRLGVEELKQPDLEGPVGVGDVVDGVQDAADLLYHLLWKCGQDQVEAQPGVGHPAAIEGGLRSEYPWSRRALVSPWLAPSAAGRLPESTTMAGVGCRDDAAAAGSSGHRICYFPWRCALLPGLLHHHTVVMVLLHVLFVLSPV